ncbi:hypothetical protein ACIQBJ_29645 [Kitasatospora sp. NPDC088391]|uniref:hypothetical protein n=1 Tax=Kitasatospora sp. NPDC088391 TaxID=3364074 RepID=UPI0037F1F761
MRTYPYVGPPDIAAAARHAPPGAALPDPTALAAWLAEQPSREGPFTYTVDPDGVLHLADRRSEHVACAGGAAVLAAGEVTFGPAGGVRAVEVSNLSTGYCPDTACWPAVAAALAAAGAGHPGGFTQAVVFRRCRGCGAAQVVREGFFVCVFCEADLPEHWNLDDPIV